MKPSRLREPSQLAGIAKIEEPLFNFDMGNTDSLRDLDLTSWLRTWEEFWLEASIIGKLKRCKADSVV